MAELQTLIPAADNASTIRDQIAAILAIEEANQRALAVTAGSDPELWRYRTFTERAEPMSDFIDEPANLSELGSPVVNVQLDQVTFTGGDTVRRQAAKATYHLDCYGYGKSEDDGAGHNRGDRLAAFAAQRSAKNVWQTIMSSYYAYLALRGVVGRRQIKNIQYLQADLSERASTRIIVGRIVLEVDYIETSPQYQGVPLELLTAKVKWADTGEVLAEPHYDYT